MASEQTAPIIWPPGEFVTVKGARIHFHQAGDGPVLILAHGLLGHSFSWRHNIPLLARHFHVYAPDLPGLGYSGIPDGYRADFSGGAEFLRDFALAVGGTSFALCGHSYGGSISLLCAARYPEHVTSLSLIAPANPFSRHGKLQVRLVASRLGPAVVYVIQRNAALFARFLMRYRLYGRPELLDAATIAGYLEPIRGRDTLAVFRQMATGWQMNQLCLGFPLLKCPTLLIWGERDKIVPLYSAAPLARALGGRLETIAGCGHMLPEEAPDVVNGLLLRFHSGSEV